MVASVPRLLLPSGNLTPDIESCPLPRHSGFVQNLSDPTKLDVAIYLIRTFRFTKSYCMCMM